MKKTFLIISIIIVQFLLTSPAIAEYHGTVVGSTDNKVFVIHTLRNDQTFVAKTLCYDVQVGDSVLFSLSVRTCDSNRFLNMRTGERCEVWCQESR